MDAKTSADWAHRLVQRHANAARALEHMYNEKNIARLKEVGAELEAAIATATDSAHDGAAIQVPYNVGQAKAWIAVCNALSEVMPDWDEGEETGQDKAVAAIRRLAALASDAVQAPEGWKLVPATATDEMLIALLSSGEADALAGCKDGYTASRLLQASGVVERYSAMLNAAPVTPAAAAPFDMLTHLARQREWSERTFGPGPRAKGVVDHIRKELREIEADPTDLTEWIDVVILALDGAWRAGGSPQQIIDTIVAKQTKNEGRIWPDWRTMPADKAIEHDRSLESAPASPAPLAAAGLINLEGLRKKLLTPRKILRDDQGFLTHPDFPVCDEGTRADKFLEAFGIETRFRSMENDLPDLHERWCDEGLDDCSEWMPTPPEGNGWLLLAIYDTEDGPYAMFGRDKYEAENALKRQRTRELSERIQQRALLSTTHGEKQ